MKSAESPDSVLEQKALVMTGAHYGESS
jgi:hypothetical protein